MSFCCSLTALSIKCNLQCAARHKMLIVGNMVVFNPTYKCARVKQVPSVFPLLSSPFHPFVIVPHFLSHSLLTLPCLHHCSLSKGGVCQKQKQQTSKENKKLTCHSYVLLIRSNDDYIRPHTIVKKWSLNRQNHLYALENANKLKGVKRSEKSKHRVKPEWV